MGRVCHSKSTKKKCYKKALDTKRRPRDVDQVQDDLIKEKAENKPMAFEIDDDLPGLGQHYCTPCARHYQDDATLKAHKLTKIHKRRLKDVAQKQYSQFEAEWASGKTKEVLPKVRLPKVASMEVA